MAVKATSANVTEDEKLHAVVVVLGDLGRSPRMQYHALSLLQDGHTVSLIGYEGTDVIPALVPFDGGNLHLHRFRVPSPKILQKVTPIYLLWRIFSLALWTTFMLHRARAKLRKTKPIDLVLVQNPPALPLLLIAYCYCQALHLLQFRHVRKARFIIDWHNLGYSMLPANSTFAMIARLYERFMAPLADGHLCVTMAMRKFLHVSMEVPRDRLRVLYDCPPSMFQPLSMEHQHEILMKLDQTICAACPRNWYVSKDNGVQTMFTERVIEDRCRPRKGRPALLTSSTSWTPDEDFGTLLAALVLLDQKIIDASHNTPATATTRQHSDSWRLIVAVTGKGPQRARYEQEISRLSLQHVAIQTLWLEPGDYPLLLACADVAVSLHTSTSGLDLPMKILDSYGCHVPVCARSFACLPELVQNDVNGRTFDNHDELAQQLWDLLEPLWSDNNATAMPPHAFGSLERYSRALHGRKRWRENWKSCAWPLIEQVTRR